MFNDILTAIEKSEALIPGSTKKDDFIVEREIINSTLQNNITLQIKFTNLSTKPISVKSVLQNAWTQSGKCRNIKQISSTRRNQIFLNRDQNPNSFQSNY